MEGLVFKGMSHEWIVEWACDWMGIGYSKRQQLDRVRFETQN